MKISELQDQVKRAQKQPTKTNLQEAIPTTIKFIDKLTLQNETSYVLRIDVGTK